MTKQAKQIILGICIVILLAGTLPWLCVRIGQAAFSSNPGTARMWWTVARYTSIYERDVILYDIANSYYRQRSYDEAAGVYAQADDIARDKTRCPIRYNWGSALSDKGDALANTDAQAARSAYSEALRILAISTCQNDANYQANFNNLAEALTEKLQELTKDEAEKAEEDKPQEGDESEAEKLLKDAEKEKQQAQNYRNQRRSDENRKAEKSDPSGDGSGDSFADKYKFVW